MPDAVELGHKARLMCRYDLEREPLYTLKWYKGEREFFRYAPKESPPIKIFSISALPELRIEEGESNSSQVVIKFISRNLSGRYNCEVTTDAPSFHAVTATGDIQVVLLPEDYPQIKLQKPKYKEGEELSIICVSYESLPAANLTWTVNSKPLDRHYKNHNRIISNASSGRETAESQLTFIVREHHFGLNSSMKIKCTASVYSIYQKVTEVVILSADRPNRYIYRPETNENPYVVTIPSNFKMRQENQTVATTIRDNGGDTFFRTFGVGNSNSVRASHLILLILMCSLLRSVPIDI